jgi:hypothetical protein
MITEQQIKRLLSSGLTPRDADQFQEELVELYFLKALKPDEKARVEQLMDKIPAMKLHLSALMAYREEIEGTSTTVINPIQSNTVHERLEKVRQFLFEGITAAIDKLMQIDQSLYYGANTGAVGRKLFEGEIVLDSQSGATCNLTIREQRGGLEVVAEGDSELVGKTFKLTIKEQKPILTFRAGAKRALGSIDIPWTRTRISPDSINTKPPRKIEIHVERVL